MRSHSTSSLNLPGRLTDAIVELPGFSHALHSLQVSQISLIMPRRTVSKPTLDKMSRILGSLAWYHLMWSFLSSRRTIVGSLLLRFCRLYCTLNLVQSCSLGAPDCVPRRLGSSGGCTTAWALPLRPMVCSCCSEAGASPRARCASSRGLGARG